MIRFSQMSDKNDNWNVIDSFERRYKGFLKDYYVLLSVSAAFLVIFVIPFFYAYHSIGSMEDVKKFINLSSLNLKDLPVKNNSDSIKSAFNQYYSNVTEKLPYLLFVNFFLDTYQYGIYKNISSKLEDSANNFVKFSNLEEDQKISRYNKTISNLKNYLDNAYTNVTNHSQNLLLDIQGYNKNLTDIGIPYGPIVKSYLKFEYVLAFAPLAVLLGYVYSYIKFEELVKLRIYIKKKMPNYEIKEYLTPFFKPEEISTCLLFVIPPAVIFLTLLVFNIYFLTYPISGVKLAPMTTSLILIYIVIGILFLYIVYRIYRLRRKFADMTSKASLMVFIKPERKPEESKKHISDNFQNLMLGVSLVFGMAFLVFTLALDLKDDAKGIFFTLSILSIGISFLIFVIKKLDR